MNNKKYLAVLIVLCIFNALLYYYLVISHYGEIDQTYKIFPERISEWSSEEVVYDPQVISALSPDVTIYKIYKKANSIPITLFMAYYNSIEKSDLSHSPIVCFTGQGWEIDEATQIEIPVDYADTTSIRVNQLLQKKLDTIMITLFWYQSTDQAFSNRGFQKICLLINTLMGKSDSNAFVRVTVSIPAGGGIEESQKELYQFVKHLYPNLRSFFLEE